MQKLIDLLNGLLADCLILSHKLNSYQWNYEGPLFFLYQEKLTTMNHEVLKAIDRIAKRIRTLGGRPEGSLRNNLSISSLIEDDEVPSSDSMLSRLIHDLEALMSTVHTIADEADGHDDQATLNLMQQIVGSQELFLWELRSTKCEEVSLFAG